MRQRRVTWPQNLLVNDVSSQISGSSSDAFPELQQLPRKAKALISQFLQERISVFQSRDEEVPFKMWSLADAIREVDEYEEEEEEKEEDEDAQTESEEGGPYSTVLHTACAIGNHWLVELQIKAEVDVTAVDSHSWTAFRIAVAQDHSTCAKLLRECMEHIKANPIPQPLPPSGLVRAASSTSAKIEADNLTATPGSRPPAWLQRRIQVRSNHPIPPDSPWFYYEMTVLSNGPLGYVRTDPTRIFHMS